jgi:hypothetical protein
MLRARLHATKDIWSSNSNISKILNGASEAPQNIKKKLYCPVVNV